jgi:Superinfection immunity protein/zinc-ribbon domain
MFHMGFPFFLVSAAFYFLPTIVAAARNKRNLLGIFLVNFLLGWSVIGWIVALVWAVSTERVDQTSSSQAWVAAPRRPFCSNCGNQGQVGSHFCAHCGQSLS